MADQVEVLDRANALRREMEDRILGNVRYGAEISAALDKIIVSLSGGALVFSMTFVDRLAPAKLWLPVLFLSWAAFVASIVGVTFGLRKLQNSLSADADELDKLSRDSERALETGQIPTVVTRVKRAGVNFWNAFSIWSFLLAIVLLGAFVARNLLVSRT